jgi:alcohol dehydrogenase, propanol-preferring
MNHISMQTQVEREKLGNFRAARFHKVGQPLIVEEVAMPKLREKEVLIKVKAAGICRGDLDMIDAGMLRTLPITMGHEISGVVEDAGSQVSTHKKGDRVLVHALTTCGTCEYCRQGRDMLCTSLFTSPQLGSTVDGGYAEFCKVDARQVLPIPSEIPFDFAATLGCAGLTAYHAVSKAGRVSANDNVVLYGVGGLGMYAIQFAKLAGANVIAIGRNEEKLKKAEDLGADHSINATKDNVSTAIKDATKGKGADIIFSFVPFTGNDVLKNCWDSFANGGRMILVALPQPLSVDPTPIIFRGFSLSGSFYGSKADLAELLELAKNNKVKSNVAKTISLDEINHAMDSLRKGEITGRCVVAF